MAVQSIYLQVFVKIAEIVTKIGLTLSSQNSKIFWRGKRGKKIKKLAANK